MTLFLTYLYRLIQGTTIIKKPYFFVWFKTELNNNSTSISVEYQLFEFHLKSFHNVRNRCELG